MNLMHIEQLIPEVITEKNMFPDYFDFIIIYQYYNLKMESKALELYQKRL